MKILFSLLPLAATVLALVTPQGFTGVPNSGNIQAIPTTAKTPGTFSNGKNPSLGESADTRDEVPDVYGAQEIDIPIGRLSHGHLNFSPTVNDLRIRMSGEAVTTTQRKALVVFPQLHTSFHAWQYTRIS
jgi:hypothetical protein